MERKINSFLFNLLGKRKRRILILTRWHAQSGDSIIDESSPNLQTLVKRFIELILYEPIRIHLFQDYMRLFDKSGLNIYYNWLFPVEIEFVKEMYMNRLDFFTNRNMYINGTIHFYGCSGQLSIENRRELVRDFVFLFYRIQKDTDFVNYLFLYVCQQLMTRKNCDVFIKDLHHALQGRFDLRNLLCR